jgi:uncharacterized NAD(P)/FAD-binding protein YdhS
LSHTIIVGGGYSGTLTAVGLLERGAGRVTLIERAAVFARGAAYGTRHPDHLLNVRAANMSAFPDRPNDFVHWLGTDDGAEFASRRDYGRYLTHVLEGWRCNPALALVTGEAMAASREGDGWTVRLRDGRVLDGDQLVLATGNMAPQPPPGVDPALFGPGIYVDDPWRGELLDGLTPEDTVLLIGTGLTMVDAVVTLGSAGFAGHILAISRRGLVPRAHSEWARLKTMVEPPEGGASAVLRAMRARVRARDSWQIGIDELRPHVQRLWVRASGEERQRFLRHLRPWWDVHRHRIAPQIHARLDAMRAVGQLETAAGKIVALTPEPGGARLVWRRRGSACEQTAHVRRIVNCTGPAGDIVRFGPPLVRGLFADGAARPDPLRLGVDVDAQCRALGLDGAPTPGLFVVGPLTKGAFWEIVAVPHIRGQVATLAARLALD